AGERAPRPGSHLPPRPQSRPTPVVETTTRARAGWRPATNEPLLIRRPPRDVMRRTAAYHLPAVAAWPAVRATTHDGTRHIATGGVEMPPGGRGATEEPASQRDHLAGTVVASEDTEGSISHH